MTKLCGEQKPTFLSDRSKKKNTVKTKRMHDGKAGTRSTKGFILAASKEAALLSEAALRELGSRPRFAHAPLPGSLPVLVFKLLFHLGAAEIHLVGELEMGPVLASPAGLGCL